MGGAEAPDHIEQGVAGVDMRGAHAQGAAARGEVGLRQVGQRTRVVQHAAGQCRCFLSRIRERYQPVAAAHKQLHANLIFQRPDQFADGGLGRVQRIRGAGHAEVAGDHGLDAAKLLEGHIMPFWQ